MGTRATKTNDPKDEEQTTGTDVTTTAEAGAVAVDDYGADAGGGFENQDSSDYGIPFLALLQPLSKSVQGDNPVGKPGMLMLTDSQECFDGKTGVLFVPSTTNRFVCEWKPRSAGGGLVARHPVGDPKVEACYEKAGTRFGKIKTPEGNDLVDTFYIYGNLVSEEGDSLGACVIGCNSTKIKPYQGIMGRLRKHLVTAKSGKKVNPPLFANLIRITTEAETRPDGTSFNFRFHPAMDNDVLKSLIPTTSPLYRAGRTLAEQVNAGQVKASAKGEGGHSAPEEEDKHF